MKKLIWKLVLPLTIISFVVFTKWWYVTVNGFDEVLTGFPIPFMSPCWHTSLCLQVFVFGLIIDVLTYFVFWLIIIFVVNRFLVKINLNKAVTITLLSFSGLLFTGMIVIGSFSDNIYTWKRSFDIKVLETGYQFYWDEQYKPDNIEYPSEMKNE